jgi:hypothetical protein
MRKNGRNRTFSASPGTQQKIDPRKFCGPVFIIFRIFLRKNADFRCFRAVFDHFLKFFAVFEDFLAIFNSISPFDAKFFVCPSVPMKVRQNSYNKREGV